jgi:hypothetical protein
METVSIKSINITNLEEDIIYFRVQNAYYKGFKKIILVGDLNKTKIKIIDRVQRSLMGLEITEQTNNSLTFQDILNKESLDINKNLNYIFTVLTNMALEIIEYIERGEEPDDKIFSIGTTVLRKCNLIHRYCNVALIDSEFLSKNKKTLQEIIIIARVVKNLQMLAKLLLGTSFILNIKKTPMMKKYHYSLYKKDTRVEKIISDYMKQWVIYFKKIQIMTMKNDSEGAADFYNTRFEQRLKIEKEFDSPSLHFFKTSAEMIRRNSADIVRDIICI